MKTCVITIFVGPRGDRAAAGPRGSTREIIIRELTADLNIEETIFAKLAAVSSINDQRVAQCMNYSRTVSERVHPIFRPPRHEVRRVATDARRRTAHPLHLRSSAFICG